MAVIKAVGKSAPANITGKDFLFFGCGKAFFILDALQAPYRCNIGGILFAWCPIAQLVVSNTEIMALILGYLRVQGCKYYAFTPWFWRGKFSRRCYDRLDLYRRRTMPATKFNMNYLNNTFSRLTDINGTKYWFVKEEL